MDIPNSVWRRIRAEPYDTDTWSRYQQALARQISADCHIQALQLYWIPVSLELDPANLATRRAAHGAIRQNR